MNKIYRQLAVSLPSEKCTIKFAAQVPIIDGSLSMHSTVASIKAEKYKTKLSIHVVWFIYILCSIVIGLESLLSVFFYF